MADDFQAEALAMLTEARGGLPERCDFCGQDYSEGRFPVPEEAGAWACSECQRRWDAEERAKR